MNICSRYHDEVVYDGHNCPMCEVLKTLGNKEAALEDALKKIQELEEEDEDE